MAGKKKKKLANRLAKMSDEDRARYMQHRADIEEETRRRKEQLISTFLKIKLDKEDGFARLNAAKLNQNWHQTLRKEKCRSMKEDVMKMKEVFERVFELKNRTIEKLVQELETADEQYSNNFQSHLIHIDKIIEFSRRCVDELHEGYERDRGELLEAARGERRALQRKAAEDAMYLKTILYRQEAIGRRELKDNREHYLQRSEDVARKNREEFDGMRREKEAAIVELWRNIAGFVSGYVEGTDSKRSHLAELRALDAESAEEIASTEVSIQRKEREIEKLQADFRNLKSERDEELKRLSESVRKYKKAHLEEKIALQRDLDLDERRLISLTEESNRSIKHLEKLNAKCDRLMTLVNACRKLETENEEVFRFVEDSSPSSGSESSVGSPKAESVDRRPQFQRMVRPKTGRTSFLPVLGRSFKESSGSSESVESNSGRGSVASTSSEFLGKFFPRLDDLKRVWIVYNRVYRSLVEMREERSALGRENEAIKQRLREVLEEVAMDRNFGRVAGKPKRFIRSAPVFAK